MLRAVLESPFMGKGATPVDKNRDTERNLRYLRACMRDCLKRGEAPYASHGLYPQSGVLDDNVPEERTYGINAGFAWGEVAQKRVLYLDRGLSTGMLHGLEEANRLNQPVEERRLGDNWEALYSGLLVPPSLAAELCVQLKEMKNKYREREGFSDAFLVGYQQGLAEARGLISGEYQDG